MSIEHILFIVAALIVLSVLASKASFKLGIPSLLLFFVLGMLAGSEGVGGIYLDDPHKAQFLGIVALIFILFAGGLDTDWRSVRPVLWQGLSLSTVGAVLRSRRVQPQGHLEAAPRARVREQRPCGCVPDDGLHRARDRSERLHRRAWGCP